jgi:hypothetical protein
VTLVCGCARDVRTHGAPGKPLVTFCRIQNQHSCALVRTHPHLVDFANGKLTARACVLWLFFLGLFAYLLLETLADVCFILVFYCLKLSFIIDFMLFPYA